MILRDHARRVLPDWPKIVGHLHSVGVHDISNASFARKHQPYKGVESWYP